MSIAKITEISAASSKSFDDAVREGLKRASKTLHNIQGAWIHEQKVRLENNEIKEWRVIMKISFVLED